MPAGEISFLLGYEKPDSFYRALHAWTGETPERVRVAALREGQAVPGVFRGTAPAN